MEYLFHLIVLVGIYTMLAVSLDLLVGHTGLLSLAQAAFFGLGAYTSAILTVESGAPAWIGVVVGLTAAILASVIVAACSLRLRGDEFVVTTLGFQIIFYTIVNNWIGLTRGALGIPGIPRPSLVGVTIHSAAGFAIITGAVCVLSYWLVLRATNAPFGRLLRSIREDEIWAEALGKNTFFAKTEAFALSAAIAAMAGSIQAHYLTFVHPGSFTLTESLLVAAVVIIGGADSTWGPICGAVVLVSLPEGLRLLGFPAEVAAHCREIVYGSCLVLTIAIRPRGIAGHYKFGR